MFPFKSHIFQYKSPLSITSLKERIDTALIIPDTWTADHSNVWNGKRINNKIIIDKWYKGWNSHAPAIKATLSPTDNNQTEIKGHFTIPQVTIIVNLLFIALLVGLCIYHNKYTPLVFIPILIILFIGVGYICFMWQYKRTKEAFENLIDAKTNP